MSKVQTYERDWCEQTSERRSKWSSDFTSRFLVLNHCVKGRPRRAGSSVRQMINPTNERYLTFSHLTAYENKRNNKIKEWRAHLEKVQSESKDSVHSYVTDAKKKQKKKKKKKKKKCFFVVVVIISCFILFLNVSHIVIVAIYL